MCMSHAHVHVHVHAHVHAAQEPTQHVAVASQSHSQLERKAGSEVVNEPGGPHLPTAASRLAAAASYTPASPALRCALSE